MWERKILPISDKQMMTMLDEVPTGIVISTVDSNALLYANDMAREIFSRYSGEEMAVCYEAFGLKETLHRRFVHPADRRVYQLRGHVIDWEGQSAYIEYITDVTQICQDEELSENFEKVRSDEYFRTIVRHLPGGVSVIRYDKDGTVTPEFISDGFAALTGMKMEDAWALYGSDAMAGVHPDDKEVLSIQLADFMNSEKKQEELVYRLSRGDGGYLWVKNTVTMIKSEGGVRRIYADYYDMTKDIEEQEQLRQQYNELIIQHYRVPGPDVLIIGHCNITKNIILEVNDFTNSDLLGAFGSVREDFFAGISRLIPDNEESEAFRKTYLNEPSLQAFKEGRTELILECYIKIPSQRQGNYVQFKVNLVETPGTGDITGILTVTDITEQTIAARILKDLSVVSYDIVADVDLFQDKFKLLSGDGHREQEGVYTEQLKELLLNVLPKDRQLTECMLAPSYIQKQLEEITSYSFSYSEIAPDGIIRTKRTTISSADMRLGRIWIATTDITESLQEQRQLLSVIAYTFEVLVLIDVESQKMTLYTRQMVLDNLPPYVSENYSEALSRIEGFCSSDGNPDGIITQFSLETLLGYLKEKPAGYDFVTPYMADGDRRYKQISVLWGDGNCKTVCMVRADVTDMLAIERDSQSALEKALTLAKEANRAKSDFLSSMSHDIRTPMNAIMGMSTLAAAHIKDQAWVEDCLHKIDISSRHLLSLINNVLDMSKIESSKITLNNRELYLQDLLTQINAIILPQIKASGLRYNFELEDVKHQYFCGDALRINQILINILGNAVKFTPEGGSINFKIQELPVKDHATRVRYRFCISDTGVGMSQSFINHIFEPFARNSSTLRVEGSGLGLSITNALVELMGGSILVESQKHQGSTFTIELTFEGAFENAAKIQTAPEDSLKMVFDKAFEGKRFLIAEDNPINSEILYEILSMWGGRSVVKADGAQTVQAFMDAETNTYDAILMDIQMPIMNGYEAARTIRSLELADAKTIPIIAMTANAFAEDIQSCLEAGMNAHVAKPIEIPVLWNTLSKALLIK